MTYIIADDDDLCLNYNISLLHTLPNINCIASCNNAITAFEQIQKLKPNFVILDIEMPNLTGIQLAQSLTVLPYLIFVTSHPHFATDAFDIDAVDYIIKPVTLPRLIRAIEKVRTLHNIKNNTPNNEPQIDFKGTTSFFVKDKSSFVKIDYQQVMYFESLGDFITIYLTNGEKKLVLVNMKNLEQQISKTNFLRISRSIIINTHLITKITTEVVVINKNIQLNIGNTYTTAIQQYLTTQPVIKRQA